MAEPTAVPTPSTTATALDTAAEVLPPPTAPARPTDRLLALLATDGRPLRVLDVGCGQDATVPALAALDPAVVATVTGVDETDRSSAARELVEALDQDAGSRVTLLVGDAAALPVDDDTADVVLLGDVLLRHRRPDAVLAEATRALAPGGRVLIAVPLGVIPHPAHRRSLYPGGLLELLPAGLHATLLTIEDGVLLLGASTAAEAATESASDPRPDPAALLAGVQPALEAALHDAEVAVYEAAIERERLSAQAAQLGAVVLERDRFEGRAERLGLAVAGERERNQMLRFQRDRYRHQAASQRVRRWWRLGAAISEARRSPARLLRLPVTLLRILTGPALAPSVPGPVPPGEAAGETTDVSQAQLRSPTETRHVARLEARYLLPPRATSVTELKVAAVVDTFTESSLEPDCDLMTFRPDTWRAALEREQPNLLFVESAWKGNGGSWEYQVGSYAYPSSVGLPHLTELVAWCRDHDVPTVFWNKEDPVHFDKFKEAARLFDVVLTTDADRIPAYEALGGAAGSFAALPFAAQPTLHHPTHELHERDPRPVFGGTYYKNRHPERREQMERLLDAARPFGLVVYDRTHGQDNDSVGFPERFQDHIRGGVPYSEMVRIYREHRLFLNTNSVIASPTMFARRIFELLACGTPVVSTPSVGVEQMFGDIVPIVETTEAAEAAMREIVTDDAAWERRSLAGMRAVLGEHTYQHRLARIASLAGYRGLEPYAERQATVLLLDDDLDRVHGLCVELAVRSAGVRLVVGTAHPERFGELPVVAIRQDTAADEVARWRALADRVETPFVVLGDALVTPEALTDLVRALPLTTADAVGFRFGGPAWRHVDEVLTAPIALRREVVAEHGWDTTPAASGAWTQRLADAGIRPYSLGDPSGRVPVRAV